MTQKIAIFGGSLDPFHLGHREIIRSAQTYAHFDRIEVIPTGSALYKKRYLMPGVYRYIMANLALADLPRVHVSRLELDYGSQPSYTVDTLPQVRQKLVAEWGEDCQLSLIYGSDILDDFLSWKDPQGILKQADLLVAMRGDDVDRQADYERKAAQLMRQLGGHIEIFPMPRLEISSTMLRQELTKGHVPEACLSPAVAEFLARYRPYSFYEIWQKLDPETYRTYLDYEKALTQWLPEKRLLHSVNVSLYALHLAYIHGLDYNKAVLAGLLHDACKYFPVAQQYELAKQDHYAYSLNAPLAHGPASAAWCRLELGVEDPEILDAIRYHTTGRPHMRPLDTLVYLADKIEYGRDYAGLEKIRVAAEHDLDTALKLCVQDVASALKRKGRSHHELSEALMAELAIPHA